METLLILFLFALLAAGWIHFRNRVRALESRVESLMTRVAALQPEQRAAARVADPDIHPEPAPVSYPEPAYGAPPPEPPAPPLVETLPVAAAAPVPAAAIAGPRARNDWEATVGGNWLNKAGVLVLVIGIALALGYSFTLLGPAGRVATSLAVSLTMLIAGAGFESRERYRIFARGLLGGGWAALYFTVYAMHAVPAARVIESAAFGAVLLFAVAVGMIAHSLRYRSQTVTGVAYFVAFATLAITQATSLSILALIPLAASLLFVAHRFAWSKMALAGLAATYSVIALRGDTGAALWQAQAILCICWLLFEAFDILHTETTLVETLLPLNAAGFLGLSLMKWNAAAPASVWMLLAASALAYLISALLRWRSGKWHGAATLAAALAAAAIFQKLNHQWIASALVVEAELAYLAGVRLRAPYLRWIGTGLFVLEAGRLLMIDALTLPVSVWAPVAALDAAVFYANRALYAADRFYGYAAALMIAVIAGGETSESTRGQTWFLLAAGPFLIGWWRRLADFRRQGYGLACLGALGIFYAVPQPPMALSVAAVLSYALALCAAFSGPDRFSDRERSGVGVLGAIGASIAAAALLWRMAPGQYLGLAWMALALLLLELGIRGLPDDLCRPAYAVALAGVLRVTFFNLPATSSYHPVALRLILVYAAILSYAIAARVRPEPGREQENRVFTCFSIAGTGFLLIGLDVLLPNAAAPAWAAVAMALLLIALRPGFGVLRYQSYFAAALAFGYCLILNLAERHHPVPNAAGAIALFFAAQFLSARGSRPRLYYSCLATALTTLLLYFESSGSLLTVAWGIEGVALLASGFPLRDRLLRLSGLALLLTCILKLFAWDLRHLETLPRILSFIVLGLILVGVSWVYTRFRDRVESLIH